MSKNIFNGIVYKGNVYKHRFLKGLATQLSPYIEAKADVDYDLLSQHIDTDEVAAHLDTSDVAEHFGVEALAECVDLEEIARYVDASCVAGYIDTSEVVAELAEHFDASDVAGYIDTTEVAEHVDISELDTSDVELRKQMEALVWRLVEGLIGEGSTFTISKDFAKKFADRLIKEGHVKEWSFDKRHLLKEQDTKDSEPVVLSGFSNK